MQLHVDDLVSRDELAGVVGADAMRRPALPLPKLRVPSSQFRSFSER
jgi:hypothetical protein